VLVFRAVVDQQQDPSGRQALHQAVEHGLRLGVDPVQILTHQEQRLHLAFPQQDALQRVERPLASLGRVKAQEGAVLGEDIQERQESRQGIV
jgi:hypothetical protein